VPIWEFRCQGGHLTEVLDVSNKSRLPSIPCPVCGTRADKVLSRVHVRLGADPVTRESPISQAIHRVRQAERQGKLD
jgi:hypothetical protein